MSISVTTKLATVYTEYISGDAVNPYGVLSGATFDDYLNGMVVDEQNGTKFGLGADNLGNYGIAFGPESKNMAGCTDGVAIGHHAINNGLSGVSIGPYTSTTQNSISVGPGATIVAPGTSSIAIGAGAICRGSNSVVMGTDAQSMGGKSNSIAIGQGSRSNANRSTAIGYNSIANSSNSISVGFGARAAGIDGIVIGTSASDNFYALRNVNVGSFTYTHSTDTIAIGPYTSAWGLESVSVGLSSYSNAQGSITIGKYTSNTGTSGTVVGPYARSTSIQGVSIGNNSRNSGNYGITIGNNTTNTASNGVLIGSSVSSTNSINTRFEVAATTGARVVCEAGGVGTSFTIGTVDVSAATTGNTNHLSTELPVNMMRFLLSGTHLVVQVNQGGTMKVATLPLV